MNILKKVLFVLFTFTISFSILGCGYKPSSYYAKEELSGNVFVNVLVDLEDPKNTVLVKDSINQILIQKLDSNLVTNEAAADIVMNLSVNTVSLEVLQYDASGYNKLYKAVIGINISYFKKSENKRKSFTLEGEYDFSVDNGTTISDSQRFEAIKSASDKALEEFISKVAVSSHKK